MLDDRIQMWRETMRQREALQVDDIEELESHLRDELPRLAAAGLSEDEAFVIATGRLGQGDDLAAEFSKVNGASIWARRVQWMLVGYLAMTVVWLCVGGLAELCALVPVLCGLDNAGRAACAIQVAGNVLGFGAVIFAALVAAGGHGASFWQTARRIQAASRSKLGVAMIVIAVLLVPIVSGVLAIVARTLMAKVMPMTEMGVYSTGVTVFSYVQGIVFPLAILVLIFWINRLIARPANAE
jgi:hypothetical protein